MKATKGEAGYIQARKKATDFESGTGIWNCHRAFDTWYLADAYKTESFDSCRRTWMPSGGKSVGGGNHNLSVSLDCRGTSERDSETCRGFDGCI